MKREYSLDEWRALRASTLPEMARLAQHRRIRRKPRSAEERQMIIRSVVAAVERRARAGRLVQVGPRAYVVRADVKGG